MAKPAAALEGTFISAHDVPVAKLWVRTYTEAPHFTNSDTVCKPDGSFVITALPPLSEGRIMAGYPPGYMPAYDALTEHGSFQQDGDILRFNCLPAGRHEGLVIRLLKAATVAGVVRDKDGKPVPNLRVLARRQGRSSRTDAEGRYEAPVMPDADVTLDFFTDFNSPPLAAASVRAAEGQRVEKDVVVPRRAPRQ